jgi:hypothetical protein
MYNRVGLVYENVILGKFQFLQMRFQSNYYYNQIISWYNRMWYQVHSVRNINSVVVNMRFRKNKWNGSFLYSRSVTAQSLSNLDAKLGYDFKWRNQFTFRYQKCINCPTVIITYIKVATLKYNWSNDFKNEKINS